MCLYLKYLAKLSGKGIFMQSSVCCSSPARGEAGNNRHLPAATGISKHFLVASTGIPPGLCYTTSRNSFSSPLQKSSICSFAAEKGKCIHCLLSSPISLVQLILRAMFHPLAENNSLQWAFSGNTCLWWVGKGWTMAALDQIIQPFNLHKPGQASKSPLRTQLSH